MEKERRELRTRKFEFSKFVTLIVILLFIGTLISSIFYLYWSDGNIIDSTIAVTAMTVTGGMVTLVIKHYMSKAKVENIYKIQLGMMEDLIKNRLTYNEEMYKLGKKYRLSEDKKDYTEEFETIIQDMKNYLQNNAEVNE